MDYQQKLSLRFNKWSDSKVSRKYIDDDVAFHVLSKLPVKSLKRFGCVRKSWSILFENSHFINMFRNHFISHSNSDDHRTYLLIFKRDCADRYHPELHLLDSRIKLTLPPPFQEDDFYLNILGKTSVSGVFCIGTKDVRGDSNKVKYVLWNPAIEEFVVIPPSPDELVPKHPRLGVFHGFHGFGYDQVRDDFKMIQYVTFDSSSCNDYDPDSPPPQVKSTYKSLLNNLVLGICEQFQELSDLWIEDNIKSLQIMEGNHHSSQEGRYMSNMYEDEDEDERVDIEANLFDGRLEGLAKWWLWLHPILITFSQHV
ncbi:F-box only protein 8 [Lathyrus oleraceus]|uniref:F-box only protein 8 n=1 Tax=Pisum sativum TaxID=3888 RepID=UPI0021CE9E47|nr:F-box only protein 8-like [Pisum sativum]